MRRAGKGCFRVETPLFEGMIVAPQAGEGAAKVNIDDVPADGVVNDDAASVADDVVPAAIDKPSIPLPTPPTQPPPSSQDIPSTSQVQHTPPPSPIAQPPLPQQQPQPSQDADISRDLLHNLLDICTTLTRRKLERGNKLKVLKLRRLKKVGIAQRVKTSNDTVMDDVSKQGRMIADMDADVDVTLKDIAKDDDDIEPAELHEVVEVVTTTKLITKVVTAATATITAASLQLTTAAAPTLTNAPSATKRRKESSNKRS
nr:hypothetical protein [Tanacetum cinerariifolium]